MIAWPVEAGRRRHITLWLLKLSTNLRNKQLQCWKLRKAINAIRVSSVSLFASCSVMVGLDA